MSIISFEEADSVVNTRTESIKKRSAPKALEEDEYLNRMANIIKRDFFPDIEFSNEDAGLPSNLSTIDTSERIDPPTARTDDSSTESIKSRRNACSLSLNNYLARYTSEDNEYFDKLQKKDLRRHRAKYPWLYKDESEHNERIKSQLALPSTSRPINSDDSSVKMIDWPYRSKNSLFYPPKTKDDGKLPQSTINYRSSMYIDQPIFKIPRRPRVDRPSTVGRMCDKVGIDGKLLNGSETPRINGYSIIPPPEVPQVPVKEGATKREVNGFYMLNESPRDELANRVYQEKVAKSIRTPKRELSASPRTKTPSSFRRNFSFSPERIKTPSVRRR